MGDEKECVCVGRLDVPQRCVCAGKGKFSKFERLRTLRRKKCNQDFRVPSVLFELYVSSSQQTTVQNTALTLGLGRVVQASILHKSNFP